MTRLIHDMPPPDLQDYLIYDLGRIVTDLQGRWLDHSNRTDLMRIRAQMDELLSMKPSPQAELNFPLTF
jgi:hypothetical protein